MARAFNARDDGAWIPGVCTLSLIHIFESADPVGITAISEASERRRSADASEMQQMNSTPAGSQQPPDIPISLRRAHAGTASGVPDSRLAKRGVWGRLANGWDPWRGRRQQTSRIVYKAQGWHPGLVWGAPSALPGMMASYRAS